MFPRIGEEPACAPGPWNLQREKRRITEGVDGSFSSESSSKHSRCQTVLWRSLSWVGWLNQVFRASRIEYSTKGERGLDPSQTCCYVSGASLLW